MKINRVFDLDLLARQLAGLEMIPGVEAWPSRIRALSRSISFLENDPCLATQLLQHPALAALESKARVIGLTGLPGAGKSSLTNLIVSEIRSRGQSVAVLAVDPSSTETGGAVLGDRIRMQEHFQDPLVYIRSMGSRGALGGVARATRGAIRLIGLLGYDYVLVETVGIGQSESEIVGIADTTVLVLMPNSGDDIQLMKAGVLQLADVYVVNKSDLADPGRMISEIQNNTHPVDVSAWCPRVLATSAAECRGVDHLVTALDEHALYEAKHPEGRARRRRRLRTEVLSNMHALIEASFNEAVGAIPETEIEALEMGRLPTMVTAGRLLSELLRK